jgi:hypothetical protein
MLRHARLPALRIRLSMDKKVPRFTPLQDIARWWESRKELSTVKRWLYVCAVPVAVVVLILFVATALTANVPKTSGWQSATEVAIEATDPFAVHTWLAVVLATTTLFLVPVVIGTAVGLVVEAQMRHMRRSMSEVLKDREINELLARVAELEEAKRHPNA